VGLTLLVLTTFFPSETSAPGHSAKFTSRTQPTFTSTFWFFVVIAFLYAFAEGILSNWAVIYLEQSRGLPKSVAAWGLSSFWAAMVAGRLLTSVLVLRIKEKYLWLAMPLLMVTALLLLPYAHTSTRGIGLFLFAGLACSGFFPLTIVLISKHFPLDTAWVSSMMIAALMVGVGMGTFLIGPLHTRFPLETLYRISAIFPLLAFLFAWIVSRHVRTPPTNNLLPISN